MVTMNDIIASIKRAMEENLQIKTYYDLGITLYNNGKVISFNPLYNLINKNYTSIAIEGDTGRITIPIQDEKDILKYKLIHSEVKEYLNMRAIEDFNSFFDKDNSITDINDLDSEDD